MRHTIVRVGPLPILGLVALVSATAVAEPGPRPLSLDDLGGVRFGWGDPPPAPEPLAPVAFERSIPAPAASALTATDLEAIAFRPGIRSAVPVPASATEPLQLDVEALGGVGIGLRN
jgi:hypothetical protein